MQLELDALTASCTIGDFGAATSIRPDPLHAGALIVRCAATIAWDFVPSHRIIADVILVIEGPTGGLRRHHHLFILEKRVPDATCSQVTKSTISADKYAECRVVEVGGQ